VAVVTEGPTGSLNWEPDPPSPFCFLAWVSGSKSSSSLGRLPLSASVLHDSFAMLAFIASVMAISSGVGETMPMSLSRSLSWSSSRVGSLGYDG